MWIAHRWRAACAVVMLALGPSLPWAKPPGPEKHITLNFVNADMESVARTVAGLMQRRLVIDPRVKGTLTLNTEKPVPASVAWDQLLVALRLQGFAVTETRGGLYKLLPESEAKLQGGADAVVPWQGTANHAQVMTQIFKLNHESANQLLPVLRPLISPNNTIQVTPGSNALVITDYADNLQRMARIIAALDVSGATDVDVIPLQHTVATDMVALLTKLTEGAANDGGYKTSILAEPRSNAVILRSANPAKQAQVRHLIDKLDRPNGESLNGNLHVVYLKNADATKLALTLRAILSPATTAASPAQVPGATPGAGNGGMIQADTATNALIIAAPAPVFQQLKQVIDALDQRRAQVLVESLIVEVDASQEAQFGIQWQHLLGKEGGKIGVLGTNFGSANNLLGLSTGNGKTLPGPGLNIGVGRPIGGHTVMTALANLLQTNGGSNILSKPTLLTLDNEEARIVVGKNVPFVTGQYTNNNSGNGAVNPFQTVERKDVGLTLKVKPQISDTGTIKLTLFQEVSSIDGSKKSTDGLITNKRAIESNIVIADGEVVVLGGLLTDAYEDSSQQVPGLGDLPLIGRLFKSESRSRNKNNLMVFLRPVVIRDDNSAEVLSGGRYKDMQQWQTESFKPTQPGLPVPNDLVIPPLSR